MRNWWLLFLWFSIFYANGQNNISSADFYEKMYDTEAYILLDVRLHEDYVEDRIPGALYAGEKEVLLKLIDDKSKETSIFIYCEYGERSKAVLKILKKKGFKNIYHLENGYLEWREQNFPIDDTKIK